MANRILLFAILVSAVAASGCFVNVPPLDEPDRFICEGDKHCADGFVCHLEKGFCVPADDGPGGDPCASNPCNESLFCIAEPGGDYHCADCGEAGVDCEPDHTCVMAPDRPRCEPSCADAGSPCSHPAPGGGVCVLVSAPGNGDTRACAPCDPIAAPGGCGAATCEPRLDTPGAPLFDDALWCNPCSHCAEGQECVFIDDSLEVACVQPCGADAACFGDMPLCRQVDGPAGAVDTCVVCDCGNVCPSFWEATDGCPPPSDEICDDLVDNDTDGWLDCLDSDCDSSPSCAGWYSVAWQILAEPGTPLPSHPPSIIVTATGEVWFSSVARGDFGGDGVTRDAAIVMRAPGGLVNTVPAGGIVLGASETVGASPRPDLFYLNGGDVFVTWAEQDAANFTISSIFTGAADPTAAAPTWNAFGMSSMSGMGVSGQPVAQNLVPRVTASTGFAAVVWDVGGEVVAKYSNGSTSVAWSLLGQSDDSTAISGRVSPTTAGNCTGGPNPAIAGNPDSGLYVAYRVCFNAGTEEGVAVATLNGTLTAGTWKFLDNAPDNGGVGSSWGISFADGRAARPAIALPPGGGPPIVALLFKSTTPTEIRVYQHSTGSIGGSWTGMGGGNAMVAAGVGASNLALAIGPDGNPIVAWHDPSGTHASRWDGTLWQDFGETPGGTVIEAATSNTALAVGPSPRQDVTTAAVCGASHFFWTEPSGDIFPTVGVVCRDLPTP